MESLCQRLGPYTEVQDLLELGVEDTLQYDPYDDESQNAEKFPILEEEPGSTQEWENQYVNTEILLLRGDRMTRGHVLCLKHDADDNPIGRYNQNPILEIYLYEVEFSWREVTELAANIIAESMYAQCEVDENEFLLLEALINHRKNDSPLSVEDQQIVDRGGETLRKSTASRDICWRWKDGSTSWEKLSNPI